MLGGTLGAATLGGLALGEVCGAGMVDRIVANIRGEPTCDNSSNEIYRCGPSQICSGSSEAGTGICHADTNFVSSLGNHSSH